MTKEDVKTSNQQREEIALACSLRDEELVRRRESDLGAIRTGFEEGNELPDGYELRYPGSDEWIGRLTEFIVNERACCPFFTFELVVEPNQGPIWLRLRGPGEVKAFIGTMVDYINALPEKE